MFLKSILLMYLLLLADLHCASQIKALLGLLSFIQHFQSLSSLCLPIWMPLFKFSLLIPPASCDLNPSVFFSNFILVSLFSLHSLIPAYSSHGDYSHNPFATYFTTPFDKPGQLSRAVFTKHWSPSDPSLFMFFQSSHCLGFFPTCP